LGQILIQPLTTLFSKVYAQRNVPAQWLVAKTILFYKNKVYKKDVESYSQLPTYAQHPKSKKLILKSILEIQDENECDIMGKNQHSFKHKRSTSTLCSQLQSIIAQALCEDKYPLIASLDLSSAFDIINVNLLIKRLKIMGMPGDLIDLIDVWLNERSYYVSIDGSNWSCSTYSWVLPKVQF
jgi:hypothetical protein